jgi:pimeloyl-ACP methyl ester carboxylesterase
VTLNATYAPRRRPYSERLEIRGLDYHVTRWRGEERSPIVLLHGWMDTGATFQFLVDALPDRWSLAAPDWRGFGRTSWASASSGGYWFPDYYADLDRLLDVLSPGEPATLVGHSMGGNIVLSYAGVAPERVRRVVCIEGFGLARTQPAQAPGRIRRWLAELREEPGFARYPSLDALAGYLGRKNPRLDAARARFIASEWAVQGDDGSWRMRSDPAHRRANPVLYRREESEACWREITAPVLYVVGADSQHLAALGEDATAAHMGTLVRRLEVCTIAASGHMIHHDQPGALAAEIDAFVRRT